MRNKTHIFKIPLSLQDGNFEIGSILPTIQRVNYDNSIIDTEEIKSEFIIISTFPDIRTKVCSLQTRHLIQFATSQQISLINISTNEYNAVNDWCAAKGLETLFVSDPQGVLLKRLGLWIPFLNKSARAVYLFNNQKKLIYKEVTHDITLEPNIDALKKAIYII